ncbi:MAG: sulfatase/phosphatase domain-containing protein [Verrucomicrobiota bacterium]
MYDGELGQVLAALDEHELFDATLVIATSDHGDMDGQHRLIYKGPFMYEHMMRVPLIIRPPACCHKPTATADLHTVNVDLVPTMADFAGVAIPETGGTSLKPLFDHSRNVAKRTFVVGQYYSKQKWVNPIRMLRTEHYKYNRYREHGEELYDLALDPGEIKNLIRDPDHRDVVKGLQAKLNQWMSDHGDPFESQTPTTRKGQALTKTG